MKNTKNINKRQNVQIADLQRKVAQLKMTANLPKKSRKKAQKKNRVSTKSIYHPQLTALVQPFKTMPGVAQHLIDALPSQKYTVRSRVSVPVSASGSFLGWLSPYAFIDNENPSGWITSWTTASAMTSSIEPIFNSTTAGGQSTPAGSTPYLFRPTRPYAQPNRDLSARLVSYGLRVAYTGAALYANGRLKVLATPHGELNFAQQTTTYASVNSVVDGSHQTQMKTIYDKAVYEFGFVGNDEWDVSGSGADQDQYGVLERVGAMSSIWTSFEPGAVFTYVNNGGSAVTFEFELVEHWEVRGNNIAPFYSESHSAPELHHCVMNVVNTAHVQAGLSSEKKFVDVVKTVSAASKSPLGKAVLAAALA